MVGQTPAALLQTMPVAAGLAFGALLLVWLTVMCGGKHLAKQPAKDKLG